MADQQQQPTLTPYFAGCELKCDICRRTIGEGSRVIAVEMSDPGNPADDWIVGHPDCMRSSSPATWKKPPVVRYKAVNSRTYASVFPLDHGGRCTGCRRSIARGEDALGVSPKQRKNKSGKWLFYCKGCISNTVFEPDDREYIPGWRRKPASAWTEHDEEAYVRHLERTAPDHMGLLIPVDPPAEQAVTGIEAFLRPRGDRQAA
jgi:hypothetical protein